MLSPTFSVIVPTYNRGHLIENTIYSVLNQNFRDFEIIVIDDGSTDNTEMILKGIVDSRLKYHKIKNAERGAARNFGVNLAIGNYVTFIDSDDIFYENHLQIANDYLKKNPQKIFWQGFDLLNSEGGLIKKFNPLKKSVRHNLIHHGNILACIGIFIPTVIAKNYLFIEDRKLSGSEDYELWLRINNDHEIYALNLSTCAMIQHEERSVSNYNYTQLEQRKLLMLHYVFSRNHNYSKKSRNKIMSNSYSYISLHTLLANTGNLNESMKYLIKSVGKNPIGIFKKRNLVILKLFILNILNLRQ